MPMHRTMESITIRRISPFFRSKIDRLHQESLSPLQIRKRILTEDNVSITSQAIKLYIIRRNQEIVAGKAMSADRSKPELRKLKPEHMAFINRKMEENDETTSTMLRRALRDEFGLDVSVTTIKRTRAELGWTSTTSRYCQMVREPNKVKRKDYCIEMMRTEEQFDNVIFTDECTIKIESSSRLSFRKAGEPRRLKGKPKHPYQVHVWAGISRRGATSIAIFTGRMDSIGYQKILDRHLLPFINEVYPDGHRLYQDNDPKHTSKSTKQWMQEKGVVCMNAPPESPDLNPIENIWGHLKQHLRRHVQPKTKDELINGIGDYWENLDVSFLNKFIDHLFKVIPVCVEKNGSATGY